MPDVKEWIREKIDKTLEKYGVVWIDKGNFSIEKKGKLNEVDIVFLRQVKSHWYPKNGKLWNGPDRKFITKYQKNASKVFYVWCLIDTGEVYGQWVDNLLRGINLKGPTTVMFPEASYRKGWINMINTLINHYGKQEAMFK